MERAHIDFVKIPTAATNNNDYESQICRFLDRLEKCRAFSLALYLRERQLGLSPHPSGSTVAPDDDRDDRTKPEDYATENSPDSDELKHHPSRPTGTTDYFKMASTGPDDHNVSPPRTFTTGSVTFHLNYDPAVGSIGIDDVAERYSLPDLHAALVHYIYRQHNGHPFQIGGQRRFRTDERLPFDKLQIWHKVRLQQHGYHDRTTPLPPQTLNAHPPKSDWPNGRYDAAFVNIDDETQWPWRGLKGHAVCEVHLIFRPIPPRGEATL